MNKYTELSDFEINKKVAEALSYKFTVNGDFVFISANVPQGIVPYSVTFDPCNNPADAWQLILEAKLSIHPDFNNDCESWIVRNIHIPMVNEAKLSRGISIAYLLMKDAENENNNNG
ncbi:phage protein NinX family protein [Providencia huashanensis]|uniref:phage protein NinX family protein n=1 Tax=Providencia huashanensis TaxID=3037798 RepID=UPI003D2AA710